MNDAGKLAAYEFYIEDMLRMFQSNFDELEAKGKNLSEFEKGRWMAYWEILETIRLRKDLISEMLDYIENDEDENSAS